jgi:hypothetical protein
VFDYKNILALTNNYWNSHDYRFRLSRLQGNVQRRRRIRRQDYQLPQLRPVPANSGARDNRSACSARRPPAGVATSRRSAEQALPFLW